ncbi:hypothetical protein [Aliidiomarina maris]|uniref:Uncharacterized protein n=1 Tax=Aliidiomarina maris TaxID=531312 RepID=A0A327X5T3_9GAMM|nr:hypothetical protein [Aliidiomarina maris]RAK01598.1 hypothetical protein B0I24_101221 [Aliidiomarina maris]RUO28424.1 hypothetical protein CWE07_01055 [Aliidiomarina maris]
MAGLLGNIALATGNNMAQYAHTKQRQDFQAEQGQAQRDHITQLEQWRAERQEKFALRARDWQVEDRDMQLHSQGLIAGANAQRAEFGQQVDFARTDLNQVNEDVSKLSAAIRNYDPMTDPDGKGMARLQEELSRIESRRAMVMEAIPDDVLQAAGPLANAAHRELVELSEALRETQAREAERAQEPQDNPNEQLKGLLGDSRFNIPNATERPSIPDLWKRFRERGMPQAPGSEYLGNRGNF